MPISFHEYCDSQLQVYPSRLTLNYVMSSVLMNPTTISIIIMVPIFVDRFSSMKTQRKMILEEKDEMQMNKKTKHNKEPEMLQKKKNEPEG